MSYESPIEMFYNDTMQNIAEQIREETDNKIVCEVKMQCGVNIDKDELIKALKYDRDQYNKGYQDAMIDSRRTSLWCHDYVRHKIYCHNCNWEVDYDWLPFCPNCGAYMKYNMLQVDKEYEKLKGEEE